MSIKRYEDSRDDYCTPSTDGEFVLYEDHQKEVDRLNAEIVKYRTALNRIAHPITYETLQYDPQEIARRAVALGIGIDPLPPYHWVRQKKSSIMWLAQMTYIKVLDPDGWDRSSPEAFEKSMEEEITVQEFRDRLNRSTICNMTTDAFYE